MKKKTVKAPLTYDPGKGRPKEHLAYLNWQEMQELQRINGGNMERGPKGLPSFPPADAIGSSSRSTTKSYGSSSGSRTYGGGGRDAGGKTTTGYRGTDTAGRGTGAAGMAARASAARRAEAARSEADRRNKDVQVKREAEARNARAMRGIPAFRDDVRKAIETPSADVRFTGPIAGTISGLSAARTKQYYDQILPSTPTPAKKSIVDRVPAYVGSSVTKPATTTPVVQGYPNVMSMGPVGYANYMRQAAQWQAGFGTPPTNEIPKKSPEVRSDISKAKDVYDPSDYENSLAIVRPSWRQSTYTGAAPKSLDRGLSAGGTDEITDSMTVDEIRDAAKKAGFRPAVYESEEFQYDPTRLGMMSQQPGEISPTDMAKLVSRSMDTVLKEKYGEEPTGGYLTRSEKDRLAASNIIQRAMKLNPLSRVAMWGAEKLTKPESVKDFLSRPSYEQEELYRLAKEMNAKYGRTTSGQITGRDVYGLGSADQGGPIGGPRGGDSFGIGGGRGGGDGSGIVSVSGGGGGADSGGGRPYVYYQWDVGVNIPSPGDPLYTNYQEYLKTREEARSA